MKQQKCTKCSKKFPTNSGMKNHMARDHQALWTPDCPEGKTDPTSLGQVIKIKKFLNCPKCNKRLNFLQYYKTHVEWCGVDDVFTCEICGHENLLLRWKTVHMQTCEKKEAMKKQAEEKEKTKKEEENLPENKSNKRRAAQRATVMLHNLSKDKTLLQVDDTAKDPDVSNPSSEDEDDDEDVDENISEEENISDEFDEVDLEDRVPSKKKYRTSRCSFRNKNPGYMNKYFPLYDLMLKHAQEHMTKPLYPDLLPRKPDWKPVPLRQCQWFTEALQNSPKFQCKKKAEVKSLRPFETVSENGFPLFSTGLPVNHIAWCPVPVDQSGDQYVAITCQPDKHKKFKVSTKTSGKQVIQIWKLGVTNNSIDQTEQPCLCYVMSHDYGHVTEMEWCPSGCWNLQETNQADSNFLPRLGILALACTDSTVRIFSIPKLDRAKSIANHTTSGNDVSSHVTVYHPVPSVTLVPNCQWLSCDITCSSVSWCPVSEHRMILAGYSDGTVRVFNLTTSSPLLHLHDNTLIPHIVFLAQPDVIRSCRWFGKSDKKIFTVSDMNDCKFWDLDNTMVPFCTERVGYQMTRTRTSLFFPGVYLASDEAFSRSGNKVRVLKPGYCQLGSLPERKKNNLFYILSQNGCVWDVCVSSWLNFCVSCDSRGHVMGMPLFDVASEFVEGGSKTYVYRLYLMKTKIQRQVITEEPSRTVSSHVTGAVQSECSCDQDNESEGCKKCQTVQSENTTNHKKAKQEQTVQSACIIRYEEFFKKREKAPVNDTEVEDLSSHDLSAQSAVVLSPNRHTSYWMIYGGQAGLVRLANIRDVLPHKCTFVINKVQK